MQRQELFDEIVALDLLLGAVCLRGQWRIFAATLGEWTLDYPAYDPTPVSGDVAAFRSGLLVVDERSADAFCTALAPWEVPLEVLDAWLRTLPPGQLNLCFVVDFDRRLFVHGYDEPIEPKSQYIPSHWRGVVGDPLRYCPPELAALWSR
jgi:hypothetical protein